MSNELTTQNAPAGTGIVKIETDAALIAQAVFALNPVVREEDGFDFDDGDDGYDFVPLRIKVDKKTFDVDEEPVKTLESIILMSQKKRVLYLTDDLDSPPVCASPDGRVGILNPNVGEQWDKLLAMPQYMQPPALQNGDGMVSDCYECQLAQFGSALNGSGGKACKERKLLVMLVKGYEGPVLLSLPTQSAVEFNRYASRLKRKGTKYQYPKVWSTLDMTTPKNKVGQTYGKVEFSLGELLSEDDKKHVGVLRQAFSAYVKEVVLTQTDVANGNGPTDTSDVSFD